MQGNVWLSLWLRTVYLYACTLLLARKAYPWVTHCKGQSSWRTTARRTFQSPWRRNNERPRHLSPGCQKRIPDKLSRRTQTASSSGKYEVARSSNLRTVTNIKQLIWCRGRWWKHVYNTIIALAICLHCSCVGSVPVGLWAQACSTKMERSGQLCEKQKLHYCKHLGKITNDQIELHHTAYLQVREETCKIKASLLWVPVLVWPDILKTSTGKYSIVIFWNKQ